MFVCKNCGEKFDTQVNFCNQCGSSAIEPEEIPVYTAEPVYTYSAPVAPASSSPAGKILGIISMVCGIVGIFFTGISFFMSFGGFTDDDIASMAMFYALFFVAFGIAGMILGSMSKNKGFMGSMATVGKTLGMVSIIVAGVAFFFSFIGLCINA
ncbi:MAG: hypothetical protein IIX21_03525 [Clostridia bacterium]|nr:hypothetical protein [Clostridia bacterium]MEE0410128.1 hypothetical protein [Clostridia bacterium]